MPRHRGRSEYSGSRSLGVHGGLFCMLRHRLAGFTPPYGTNSGDRKIGGEKPSHGAGTHLPDQQRPRDRLSGYRDWSLSFIGAEVEPVTGYSPDTFTSGAVGWKEIIHPDDMEQVKEAFRKAEKEKSDTLCVEYGIRNKDGGIRWIEDRRQLTYGESGDFAKVDGMLLDITDRKRAEESQARLAMAVEQSTDMIVVTDREGRSSTSTRRSSASRDTRGRRPSGGNPASCTAESTTRHSTGRLWGTLVRGEVWDRAFHQPEEGRGAVRGGCHNFAAS